MTFPSIFNALPILKANVKGGRRDVTKALLYCSKKRLHIERATQLNVRDIGLEKAGQTSHGVSSWDFCVDSEFVLVSLFQVIVIYVVLVSMSHALLILTPVNLFPCLCFAWWWQPPTRWCHWHSLPRVDQLWPADGKCYPGIRFYIHLDVVVGRTHKENSCFCPCYCYLIS